MEYSGRFNDQKKEFTIEDMFPKRPLSNFLWNEKMLTCINQFGFGGSSYRDNSGETVVQLCKDSRAIYIKDEEDKKYWVANRNFSNEPFDEFNSTVGIGYSRIYSKFRDISTTFNLFIQRDQPLEFWEVTIKNSGKEERNLSLFTYADVECNITPHTAYNRGIFSDDLNGVFLSHHGFNLPTNFSNIFFACNKKITSFETTNRRFKGIYGSIESPKALEQDFLTSEATSFDDQMTGALQVNFRIGAGKEEKFCFILGLSKSLEEAIDICRKNLNEANFKNEYDCIKEENTSYHKKLLIDTPDDEINRMVNIWLKRQMGLGKTWGRVYSKGFRDIMQDLTGFMSLDSKAAAEKIIYCLNFQYQDGNTLRQWAPIDLHPYRDGASWLIPAVASYLKETGDYEFLEREVFYYGNKEKGTILDHCKRGIDFLLSELGEHGLCLWGGGDWNDSINNAGIKLKGESVWLSLATVKSTNEYIKMLDVIGRGDEIQEYIDKIEKLKNNIVKYGWDKDHFIYGFNDYGEKIGSYENTEGKIYLNPQTWAILADVVNHDSALKLLEFIERELSCPFGYVQLKPSYTKGTDRIGRISYMEPGCYENGSVYNHGVAFKIAADCKMGRGDIAYRSIKKMFSSNRDNPASNSGVEPYVLTNMFLGPENVERCGESLMSWITGTAGWAFRCITEFLIGVQADYNGLCITPCFPTHWKRINIIREYRNATYDISIINDLGLESGNITLIVDDKLISGNAIPPFEDQKIHKVIAKIYK